MRPDSNPAPTGRAYDREAMRRRLQQAAERARSALNGPFADAYRQLRAINPGDAPETDNEAYETLIALLQEATQRNLDHARLRQAILDLKPQAVALARKIPALVGLLL